MSDVGSLTREMVRRSDCTRANSEADVRDLKLGMSTVEGHFGTIIVPTGGSNHRMSRFGERLSRLERRLDLSDAR